MRILPLIFACGLMASCGKGDEKRPRPDPLVTVAPVTTYGFADRYEAIGTATANEQVTLTAPVTERITRLGFTDGQFVRRGQVMAVLAQGQESAALQSAQARSREAQQQLARIQALKDRGFATKSSLDAQLAAAASANADAAEVRASIGDRVIRAPFSGYASLRQISVGAVVGSGTEIATISDTGVIKLDFTVPETMLQSVRAGQSVIAKSAAYPDRNFGAVIRAIDPVIDPVTRAVRVRATLPNPSALIKPGMLLTVTIESRPREGLGVPELAIVNEGEARFVYSLGNDSKVKRTPVKTGGRNGNIVEVLDGLTPGTRIVTDGVVKLSDGVKVRTGGGKPGGSDPKGAAAK